MMVWTPDTEDMLRWLVDQRQSASSCADFLTAAFGVHFTRNMCIGKARRMGMFFTSTLQPKRAPEAKKSNIGAGRVVAIRKARAKPTWRASTEPAPTGGTVKFLDRRPGQCAYPFGEPKAADFMLCGAPAVECRPYCPAHMAIAY